MGACGGVVWVGHVIPNGQWGWGHHAVLGEAGGGGWDDDKRGKWGSGQLLHTHLPNPHPRGVGVTNSRCGVVVAVMA